MEIGHWPMIRTASLSMHVPSSHWNRTRISRYAPTSMLSQRDIGGTGRALSNCVFLRRLRVRRENTAEPAQQTLKQYRHQHRLERVPHTGRMAVERLDRRTHILAYNSILAYSPKGGVSQKQKGFRGDLETLAGG